MANKRKKVLIIAYYFPPTGGGAIQRTVKLTKYLSRLGWDPYVLTVKDIYYKAYDGAPLGEIPNIPVIRAGSLGPLRLARILRGPASAADIKPIGAFSELENRSGIGVRPYSKWQRIGKVLLDALFPPDIAVFWVPFALARGVEVCFKEGIDVIYSVSPQESAHLVGSGLKKITGLPWIADLTDPWVGHLWREQLPAVSKKVQESLEKKTLRHADALVLNTEAAYRIYTEKFPDINKQILINNGFDTDDFKVDLPNKNQGEYVIVHIGNFNKEQRADTIITGFKVARETNPEFAARAKLYLIGANKPEDFELVEKLELNNAVFDAGYVSYYDAVRCAKAADLCLIYKGPGISGASITGKFYIYIGAEKPIIGITPSEATHELANQLCSRYYPVNPVDIMAISSAFLRAFEDDTPQRIDWEKAVRFDYANIAAEVAGVLERKTEKL